MEDNWKYIDDIKSLEGINTVHCDTRDFHCLLSSDFVDLRDGRKPEVKKAVHIKTYQISEEEIIPLLKSLETMSGGKAEWRMLNFNISVEETGGWLKYIRLYRIKGSDKFIFCNRDDIPIDHRRLSEENLIKEHLNTVGEE